MSKSYVRAVAAAALFVVGVSAGSTVSATPFQPVMDEFWIVKNGSQIFRDSFNDGAVPASGPDGATTYSPSPQSGLDGMTSETGGKLTMTPALGAPVLINGYYADTFTGGLRLAGLNPASGAGLAITDSVEIHGLFDLTSLPTIAGQQFGVRLTDRSNTNEGDDIIQISVVKSPVNGEIGVRFADLDFVADTSETAGFASIESLLPSASQIELVITKAAGTNVVGAYYVLYDAVNAVVGSGVLDNINDVTLNPLTVYNGETFTRAQFFATDSGVPIDEPAGLAILAFGVVAAGVLRRRRAA